jgi:hypothetical protein
LDGDGGLKACRYWFYLLCGSFLLAVSYWDENDRGPMDFVDVSEWMALFNVYGMKTGL